ncbi:MAG: hypothetical protein CL693_14880 [Cellvibrionaceae bacterium]|nr:hypothetical protein [Cellvibrionaceae bacterium]
MQPTLPPMPYLGARLRALLTLIEQVQSSTEPYHTLYDCCCDHGYLGIKLLRKNLCQHLHFNDQVPHLIDDLQQRLDDYPADAITPSYSASAADAGQLQINPQNKSLIILAGIGGEHMVNILKPLLQRHSDHQLDFLFCPTTTQFDLREYLSLQKFSLIHESLVQERGRSYEVIHARWQQAHGLDPVSPTGAFWSASEQSHLDHLSKLIKHYQRRTLGDQKQQAQRVLGLYLTLWLSTTGTAFDFG